jgi:hypothetical protein
MRKMMLVEGIKRAGFRWGPEDPIKKPDSIFADSSYRKAPILGDLATLVLSGFFPFADGEGPEPGADLTKV